ncbi:Pkinase-domain-containing protein [Microstroma glucosiphilum]|uniref:cyclin-dependent kinase n=1 Tax=Pseudomicrostroma glucosiphilum TaxID=1684307 RepID=A0A316U2N0_9BASI|nr:Pkinase-domain-containing protein [Pseudomicrostroma glucosiphilum]PWN19572.1 Pkinase-domain-containing protein [Pseudomicrostroma glucosiphilum]
MLRRQQNGGEGSSRLSEHHAPVRIRPPRPPPTRGPIPPRSAHPPITSCSSVSDYEKLNHIEEGTYGVVFRARHRVTGEVVALKKLKMDRETNGFPITSLREIRTLMMAQHENVVRVKEVVVGETLTQIFIVFEFVEHDIKTLLTAGEVHFTLSEIKTLLHQLLSAVSLLHSQWIIHRDLKTSNLLMNNRGQLKLADFGLARLYGDPPMDDYGGMTSLVVTLWYRAPELLLGAKEYDTAIDMWSVGCIFAEFLKSEPLFTGKNESDQLYQIFSLLGRPTSSSYPPLSSLSTSSSTSKLLRSSSFSSIQPYSTLRASFPFLTSQGQDLLSRLLTYDPARRITAQQALQHPWFTEAPLGKHPDSFGSFPSWAAGERKRKGGAGGGAGTEATTDAPGGGADRRRKGAVVDGLVGSAGSTGEAMGLVTDWSALL